MKQSVFALLAAMLVSLTLDVSAADELKAQSTCPVMGGKINTKLYADTDGKRIYVCCAGCIAPIKKDPAKYIKALADKGQKPAVLQTKCPVMDGKLNKQMYVDHDGKRIYVCCKGCIAPIKKDPSKYLKKMAKDGVVPHDIPKKSSKTEGAKHEGS
ncbi:hypothetical protein BVY04_01070 [bacterium M21]|nr:hypothetical protein BVY04_01070 [bacterium M21]